MCRSLWTVWSGLDGYLHNSCGFDLHVQAALQWLHWTQNLNGRRSVLFAVSVLGECLIFAVRARGVKSRMCPPYPQRDRKRRLNGAVCRNHRIKRVAPCRCLDGHIKEPYEMSMAWEPDCRSNFFFNPPAHLCAVTCMTEISLIVTLNNKFTSHSHHLSSPHIKHW